MTPNETPYFALVSNFLVNYYVTTFAIWFGHWFAHLKKSPLAPFHVLGHHAFYPDSRNLLSKKFIYGQRKQSSIYSLLPWLLVQTVAQFLLLSWQNYLACLIGQILIVAGINQIHTEFHLRDSHLTPFSWFQNARRRHAYHHDEDVNYMVADHSWDRLFGTFADALH